MVRGSLVDKVALIRWHLKEVTYVSHARRWGAGGVPGGERQIKGKNTPGVSGDGKVHLCGRQTRLCVDLQR